MKQVNFTSITGIHHCDEEEPVVKLRIGQTLRLNVTLKAMAVHTLVQ